MIIQYQLFSTQMCRNDACQLDETSYDTDITQLLSIVEICLPITYINSIFAFAKISLNATYGFLSFLARMKQLYMVSCISEKLY